MNKQDRELLNELMNEVKNSSSLTNEDKQIIKGVSEQMKMIQTDLQATNKEYKKIKYRIEAMIFLLAITSILILFKWYV